MYTPKYEFFQIDDWKFKKVIEKSAPARLTTWEGLGLVLSPPGQSTLSLVGPDIYQPGPARKTLATCLLVFIFEYFFFLDFSFSLLELFYSGRLELGLAQMLNEARITALCALS